MEPGNDLVINDVNYGEYSITGKTAIIYANQQWDLIIEDAIDIPERFHMIKAYPNPFNAQIKIQLDIHEATTGIVQIYDVKGLLVRSFDQTKFEKGGHHFVWDSRSVDGIVLSSGFLIVAFNSEIGSINTKILLLK